MKKNYSVFILLFCFLPAAFSETKKLIVAQDGTGNYKTVQQAIDAVKDNDFSETIIYIKKGVYKKNFACRKLK